MSRFGNAQWWSQQAPLLLAIALLLATAAHLSWRSVAWLQLLRSEPIVTVPRVQAPTASVAPQQLAHLFGLPPRAEPVAPPPTRLRLTLHGSFVHPDPLRSSAIIQSDGGAARLLTVNGLLEPGVRLHAVYSDRVEIDRNGQLETLTFPKRRQPVAGSGITTAARAAPADAPAPEAVRPEQLALLQEEQFKQLRERMAVLRQRIHGHSAEADPPVPHPDSLTQSD
ncbi:MAG TPA: type II secretion system protein N [Pseudomonas sp.]|nr:type II secretion system protein N [Pseudomonas sp.]